MTSGYSIAIAKLLLYLASSAQASSFLDRLRFSQKVLGDRQTASLSASVCREGRLKREETLSRTFAEKAATEEQRESWFDLCCDLEGPER